MFNYNEHIEECGIYLENELAFIEIDDEYFSESSGNESSESSKKVEERFKNLDEPLTIATMGCPVNGPGEAKHADFGIAGAIGEGYIFRKGEMVDAICENTIDQEKPDDEDDAKVDRILNAPIGTLVAFYEPETRKMNTAKMTNRNRSKRLIKCETQYGKEFVVPFNDVAWVKTGTRWPKGVYQLLKGKCDGAEKV